MSFISKILDGILYGSNAFRKADSTISSAVGKGITSKYSYNNARRISALLGTSSIGRRVTLSSGYLGLAYGANSLTDIGVENAQARYGSRFNSEFGDGGSHMKSMTGFLGLYFGSQALFGRDFISRGMNTYDFRFKGGKKRLQEGINRSSPEKNYKRYIDLKAEKRTLKREIAGAKGTSNVYELNGNKVDAATFISDRTARLSSTSNKLKVVNRRMSEFQSALGSPRNAIDDILGTVIDRPMYQSARHLAPSYSSTRALGATGRGLTFGAAIGIMSMSGPETVAFAGAGVIGMGFGATGAIKNKANKRAMMRPIGVQENATQAASSSFLGEAAVGFGIGSIGAIAGIGLGLHMSDVRNNVAEGNITSMDQRSNIHKLNYSTAGLVQALHRNNGGY